MPWPQLLFDQTDLRKVCAPRGVDKSRYHLPNQLYGQDSIIREYAGLSADEPVPWAMEHFVSFDAPQPYLAEAQTELPIVLAVSEGQADVLRRSGQPRALPIGSAYYYMRQVGSRLFPDLDRPCERRGTLVFPDKSTIGVDLEYDRHRFARDLAALPSEFQPVAVSIFWKELELGTHQPFADAGLLLVSSGHSFDPLFLFRQYDLCRQFKYSCANDLSTSFCLSVLAGCRFFHWPTGPLRVTRGGVTTAHDQEPTLVLPGKQRCLAASPFPPQGDGIAQQQLAEHYAGKVSVRPPEWFRRVAEEGNRLLQASPREVLFEDGVEPRDWASWLPWGFVTGGWALQRSGLTLPPTRGRAGVRLHLDISARCNARWSANLLVEVDGQPHVSLPVRRGRWRLDIIGSDEEQAVPIKFEMVNDSRFSQRPQGRAFRLEQLEWFDQTDSSPAAAEHVLPGRSPRSPRAVTIRWGPAI